MADPVMVTLTRDTWVKVATAVTSAIIDVRKAGIPQVVYQTYRMTGGSAPTDLADGINMADRSQLVVNTASAIDVYLYAADTPAQARVST